VDAAKSGGQEVRVGEVFVECAEKTGFPGFGFSQQGSIGAWRSQKTAPGKNLHFGRSKVGGWVYTHRHLRSKMEIPAYSIQD
jgi:hypothetical protein